MILEGITSLHREESEKNKNENHMKVREYIGLHMEKSAVETGPHVRIILLLCFIAYI